MVVATGQRQTEMNSKPSVYEIISGFPGFGIIPAGIFTIYVYGGVTAIEVYMTINTDNDYA